MNYGEQQLKQYYQSSDSLQIIKQTGSPYFHFQLTFLFTQSLTQLLRFDNFAYNTNQSIESDHFEEYCNFFRHVQTAAQRVYRQKLNEARQYLYPQVTLIGGARPHNPENAHVQAVTAVERGGAVITYKIVVGLFLVNVRCLNLPQPNPGGGTSIGRGSFGEVFLLRLGTQEFIRKQVRFKPDQKIPFQVRQTVLEYALYLIADFLGVGPRVRHDVGFDLVCFDDSIEFYLQRGLPDYPQAPDFEHSRFEQRMQFCLRLLHLFRIVHKDVKPSNILFSPCHANHVFTDFGISEALAVDLGALSFSYCEGTLAFMSPEMKATQKNGPCRLDLYYNDMFALQTTINFIKSNQYDLYLTQFRRTKLFSSVVHAEIRSLYDLHFNFIQLAKSLQYVQKADFYFPQITGPYRFFDDFVRENINQQFLKRSVWCDDFLEYNELEAIYGKAYAQIMVELGLSQSLYASNHRLAEGGASIQFISIERYRLLNDTRTMSFLLDRVVFKYDFLESKFPGYMCHNILSYFYENLSLLDKISNQLKCQSILVDMKDSVVEELKCSHEEFQKQIRFQQVILNAYQGKKADLAQLSIRDVPPHLKKHYYSIIRMIPEKCREVISQVWTMSSWGYPEVQFLVGQYKNYLDADNLKILAKDPRWKHCIDEAIFDKLDLHHSEAAILKVEVLTLLYRFSDTYNQYRDQLLEHLKYNKHVLMDFVLRTGKHLELEKIYEALFGSSFQNIRKWIHIVRSADCRQHFSIARSFEYEYVVFFGNITNYSYNPQAMSLASNMYERKSKISNEVDAYRHEILVLPGYVMRFANKGYPEKATQYLQRYIFVLQKSGKSITDELYFLLSGMIARSQKNYVAAKKHFEEAFRICLPNRKDIMSIYKPLIELTVIAIHCQDQASIFEYALKLCMIVKDEEKSRSTQRVFADFFHIIEKCSLTTYFQCIRLCEKELEKVSQLQQPTGKICLVLAMLRMTQLRFQEAHQYFCRGFEGLIQYQSTIMLSNNLHLQKFVQISNRIGKNKQTLKLLELFQAQLVHPADRINVFQAILSVVSDPTDQLQTESYTVYKKYLVLLTTVMKENNCNLKPNYLIAFFRRNLEIYGNLKTDDKYNQCITDMQEYYLECTFHKPTVYLAFAEKMLTCERNSKAQQLLKKVSLKDFSNQNGCLDIMNRVFYCKVKIAHMKGDFRAAVHYIRHMTAPSFKNRLRLAQYEEMLDQPQKQANTLLKIVRDVRRMEQNTSLRNIDPSCLEYCQKAMDMLRNQEARQLRRNSAGDEEMEILGQMIMKRMWQKRRRKYGI